MPGSATKFSNSHYIVNEIFNEVDLALISAYFFDFFKPKNEPKRKKYFFSSQTQQGGGDKVLSVAQKGPFVQL